MTSGRGDSNYNQAQERVHTFQQGETKAPAISISARLELTLDVYLLRAALAQERPNTRSCLAHSAPALLSKAATAARRRSLAISGASAPRCAAAGAPLQRLQVGCLVAVARRAAAAADAAQGLPPLFLATATASCFVAAGCLVVVAHRAAAAAAAVLARQVIAVDQ